MIVMYVLVSPCILHPELRATGITSAEDKVIFSRCIDRFKAFNIDIVELPCPETQYFGSDRIPGPFIGKMNIPEFIACLDHLESDVLARIHTEKPLAIIGVNSSPTCGVTTTYYTSEKSAGPGVFLKRFAGKVPLIDVKEASKYSIYLTGAQFSNGKHSFTQKLASELANLYYFLYLPQEFNDNLETDENTRDWMINQENLDALKNADIVVAIIDGTEADPKTAWEMGYATARGKRVIALRPGFPQFSNAEHGSRMLEMEICTSIEELIKKLTLF